MTRKIGKPDSCVTINPPTQKSKPSLVRITPPPDDLTDNGGKTSLAPARQSLNWSSIKSFNKSITKATLEIDILRICSKRGKDQ